MNFWTLIENLVAALKSAFRKDAKTPPVAPKIDPPAPLPPQPVPMDYSNTLFSWDTPARVCHNVRVLCDRAGLTPDEKNLICACIFQESRFHNEAVNHNRAADGTILSTDYGLAQVNDHYHIGPGKDFPTVQYVLDNPDKVIEWMIGMYKHGLLKQWVSYSSGAYKQWLQPNSPLQRLIVDSKLITN